MFDISSLVGSVSPLLGLAEVLLLLLALVCLQYYTFRRGASGYLCAACMIGFW